jgi:uncharacterized coiled-coil protein SlyX
MSSLKQKLAEIKELRAQRNSADESLYKTNIELRKIEKLINARKRKDTVYASEDEAVKEIRAKIALLEKKLGELNKELAAVPSLAAKIKELEDYIEYLNKKIPAVESSIGLLKAELAEEKNSSAPYKTKIKELEEKIAAAEALIEELKGSLAAAQNEKKKLIEEEKAASDKRKQISEQKNNIAKEIDDLQKQLSLINSNAGWIQDDLEQKRGELKENYDTYKGSLAARNEDLHAKIDKLYEYVHPETGHIYLHPQYGVAQQSDSIPYLLFPVRIETRFITELNTPEIWVRVYPDDISVHTHEKLLTEKEAAEGKRYWAELFNAEKENDSEERETLKRSAWTAMVTLFGGNRSAWIAKQMKPSNWDTALPDETALAFPAHETTKTDSWTQAPRTKLLPDRFVVMFYEGETKVNEVVGNLIPDILYLGPDPMEAEDSFVTENGRLKFGQSFDWASDFPKAVECGMGFKMQITYNQASSGFSKILVLGVYLSADEDESSAGLGELIDNHHYSKKGFSILPQGSATNNTGDEGSGYTTNDSFNNLSYYVETGPPLFNPLNFSDLNCDGMRLADAFGIEYSVLQYINNSNAKEFKEAILMNKALYPGTLGYYLETLMQPVFNSNVIENIQNFFTGNVTGRGPLPAFRVADQPYGIVLTSDFTKWKAKTSEGGFSAAFLNALYKVLMDYQKRWDDMLKEVSYVGKPGKSTSEIIMNILGLQAGSVTFHHRAGYSTEYLQNLDDFQWGGKYGGEVFINALKSLYLLDHLGKYGYNKLKENGEYKDIPQLFKILYQHYTTLLDSANVVDNVPLSEKDVVRYYDEANKKNYLHWLAEANTIDKLEQQDFGAAAKPNSLLYLKLRHALLLQVHKTSVEWFNKRSIAYESTLLPKNFHNIRPQGDLTKYEVMRAKVEIAEPQSEYKNLTSADYFLNSGAYIEEARYLTEIRNAIAELADVPTARLERCFAEHIDTLTYRLDSWQTALFGLRLQKQRTSLNPAGGQQQGRKNGIYIGAYGWLENIRPSIRFKADINNVPEKLRPEKGETLYEYEMNGGFIHAPSLNHASAAALLKSGYMSHADKGNPEIMSVNLSSERVRRGLFILQGMRNGQTLEALLGYQFERALHDWGSKTGTLNINQYIYNFRDKFPIKQNLVPQQGSSAGSTEAIAANNVVNGVLLAETTASYPYGVTGLEGISDAEKKVIKDEKDRLADSLDAVKDLLMSESAYQLVQGNFDRAGAVMDAIKDSHIPQEIDVINTPRSAAFTFTNRVTLHFENLDPYDNINNPWSPVAMTPRAIMEPGINKWLGGILGNPADIICRVSHEDSTITEMNLSQLNLQPIDFIYITNKEISGGATELESRIAYLYRQSSAIDDELTVHIEFSGFHVAGKKTFAEVLPLAAMLKSLITDSRHLNAEDFEPHSKKSAGSKENPKNYDTAELPLRIDDARGRLNTYLAELLAIPFTAIIGGDAVTNLEEAFIKLEEKKLTFADIEFIFPNISAASLQSVLIKLAAFGIEGAFPSLSNVITAAEQVQILTNAQSVTARAQAKYTDSGAAAAEAAALTEADKKIEKYIQAGKIIFGDVFNILPKFSYNNEADIQLSNNDRAQLLKYAAATLKMNFPADEWLQSTAHVRPKILRWETIRTLHEAFNVDPLEVYPVQIPYRAKDNWLAVEFPETDELDGSKFGIKHDTISLIAHGAFAFTPAVKQSGLLIDDWTEVVPLGDEITGITFNYNQPNAVPPQALLLAVTPEETGHWKWENLVGILNDTLERAKRRAVEPLIMDNSGLPEASTLLPAVISEFTSYDLNVSLDYRLNLMEIMALIMPVTVTKT